MPRVSARTPAQLAVAAAAITLVAVTADPPAGHAHVPLAAAPAVVDGRTAQAARLQAAIRDRVRRGDSTAIVAGLVFADGSTKVVTAGGKGRAFPGGRVGLDSAFEIGSVTKTFTATVLADMVRRGEVSLDDPVRTFLPAGVTVPSAGGEEIRLRDLATHTSGLPREATNLDPADVDDPYADYREADLLEYLKTAELSGKPGAAYEYSNLGYGLLGYALARRAGTSYADLVRTRVFAPLALSGASVATPGVPRRRDLLTGHDADGLTTPAFSMDLLAPAGAILATPRDLVKYLQAQLGAPGGGALGPAIEGTHAVQFEGPISAAPTAQARLGLAWTYESSLGRDLLWHDGGTIGFSTIVAIDPSQKAAVFVVSDTRYSVVDIGLNALDAKVPLTPALHLARVSGALLDHYAGRYASNDLAVEITRDRKQPRLWVDTAGMRRTGIYPTSARTFVAKESPLEVTFTTDRRGRVTGIDAVYTGEKLRFERVR